MLHWSRLLYLLWFGLQYKEVRWTIGVNNCVTNDWRCVCGCSIKVPPGPRTGQTRQTSGGMIKQDAQTNHNSLFLLFYPFGHTDRKPASSKKNIKITILRSVRVLGYTVTAYWVKRLQWHHSGCSHDPCKEHWTDILWQFVSYWAATFLLKAPFFWLVPVQVHTTREVEMRPLILFKLLVT